MIETERAILEASVSACEQALALLDILIADYQVKRNLASAKLAEFKQQLGMGESAPTVQ